MEERGFKEKRFSKWVLRGKGASAREGAQRGSERGEGAVSEKGPDPERGGGAVVNSSRGLIGAWKNKKYADYGEEHFAEAARAAVIDMKNDLNSVL